MVEHHDRVGSASDSGGRSLVEAELEVQNVLNLLNARWGLQREAASALLEHVGQTGDSPQTSRPIFRFTSTNVGWTTNPDDSAFQLQLAMRYRF